MRRGRRWRGWPAGPLEPRHPAAVKPRTLALGAVALLALGAAVVASWGLRERSPNELLRAVRSTLNGVAVQAPALSSVVSPLLAYWQAQIERPAPETWPELGRGPRPATFESTPRALRVDTAQALARAMRTATAGQVIAIAPGRYRIEGTLVAGHAGRADAPITLRPAEPGSVELASATTEAFKLAQPHWRIEHLTWRGVCERDHDCEHALHVVGAAVGTVIQDNQFLDFNAALKVNGEGGASPDDGVVAHNRFVNGQPRRTDRPVTIIDIVGASRWTVHDNVIAGFVKDGGNGISYGAFMKGGGRGGRFERNLVVCTPGQVSQPGVRVGLSLGGGLTGASACREQPCLIEHHDGLIADNIIAHCNDVGIDLHRAVGARVVHNTLINTAGITARGEPTSAQVRANLLDGRVRARAPAELTDQDNLATDLRTVFDDADALALGWRIRPDAVPSAGQPQDFCGRPRPARSPPGALVDGAC